MMAFFERHFAVFMLMLLLVMLFSGHAFMIHASRPHEQITWIEGMIGNVFAGILALLSVKKDNP